MITVGTGRVNTHWIIAHQPKDIIFNLSSLKCLKRAYVMYFVEYCICIISNVWTMFTPREICKFNEGHSPRHLVAVACLPEAYPVVSHIFMIHILDLILTIGFKKMMDFS